MLHILGTEIKRYALPTETADDHYCLIKGDSICNSVYADLRNREQVIKELVAFEPDFVFHLAAQPLVRHSYLVPADTFEVNTLGTVHVLEGMRQLKKSCFGILITTDKVYHNNETSYAYQEQDRLGGYDPYSASKACAELVIDSYRNSFFNTKFYNDHRKAIAVARAGNVIGGGDWAKDRLVPDIARALGRNETIIIRNPKSVRPWQHVLEPLTGYLLLGAKLVENPAFYSQAYNFGPYVHDILSVEELVKNAIVHFKSGNYRVDIDPSQPHEAKLLQLDISKAIRELGWKPRFNAAQTIDETIGWYKKFIDKKEEAAAFTEIQVNKFLALSQLNEQLA